MDADMAITAINVMVPKILCLLIRDSPALLTDYAPEIRVDHLFRAYAYANSTERVDRSWRNNPHIIIICKYYAKPRPLIFMGYFFNAHQYTDIL